MVFCCFACGAHYNPLNTRTFHRFPNNKDLKQKWLEAIGKTEVYNGAVICSDHFDEDDYSENTYATRKRLRPNVVPHLSHESILLIVESDDPSSYEIAATEENTSDDVDMLNLNIPAKCMSDITTEANISHDTEPSLDVCQNVIGEAVNDCKTFRKRPLCDYMNETEESNLVDTVQEVNQSRDQQSELTLSDKTTLAANTNESQRRGRNKITKVFVKLPNNGTDYFTREDFTSDLAWNRFLKTMTFARYNRKVLKQQCLKHKNRVADMKKLLLIYVKKDQERNIP